MPTSPSGSPGCLAAWRKRRDRRRHRSPQPRRTCGIFRGQCQCCISPVRRLQPPLRPGLALPCVLHAPPRVRLAPPGRPAAVLRVRVPRVPRGAVRRGPRVVAFRGLLVPPGGAPAARVLEGAATHSNLQTFWKGSHSGPCAAHVASVPRILAGKWIWPRTSAKRTGEMRIDSKTIAIASGCEYLTSSA